MIIMHLRTDSLSPSDLNDYGRHVENKKYRYYCSGCCRNFETNEKAEKCIRCGHTTLHVLYPWKPEYRGNREAMLNFFKESFAKLKMPRKATFKLPSFGRKTEELPSQ